MRFKYLTSALLGGVSLLTIANAANAQTAASGSVDEVVVTGSRVTNGNNSPTPVTVVQTADLRAMQPTTINDALNNLPVFQGSRGQFSTPSTAQIYGAGNPASTQLNLRNLGTQRTLVLFDGQRVAPSTNLGIVDVDMVPQELIQRVDIVTGGVSAVYGSDAIAGVVNYVVDKKFNGFKVDASYGISSRNDDHNWRIGIAAGTALANERGHIELSFNHYDDDGILARRSRPYSRYALLGTVPGATLGTAANPYGLFDNVHNAANSFGGLISNGPLRGQQFAADGVLSAFNAGTPTGTALSNVGGDGTYFGFSSLKAAVKFDQLFARFDFDLSDDVHFHSEAAASRKQVVTFSEPGGIGSFNFNNQVFSTSNGFLTASQRTALNPTGATPTFTLSHQYLEIPLLKQLPDVRNLFVNSGFDGKLGKFKWSLNYNFSDNRIHDQIRNNINGQRFSAALDAVVNPANGQVVCNASLTNAAFSNCVPFNAFGPTAASPAAVAYVTETSHLEPHFTQNDVGGSISGEIFSLPAGPVMAALSADWRKQSFTQNTDAPSSAFNPCAGGLRYNCGPTTPIYNPVSFASSGRVSQSVTEGAIEADVPILKDAPMVQAFNLNGAARYTAYDFGGKGWTWKVGMDWHVNSDVRIRGTISRDIEAPALAYLFRPTQVAYAIPTDYLTNVTYTASVPTSNVGNPDLVSEIGHTKTLGVVWRPSFIPRFSVSLDTYHIEIDGALVQIIGGNVVTQQACYASGGTSPLCALQVRALNSFTNTSPANAITSFTSLFMNSSKVETKGADLEVNYGADLFTHFLNTRLLVSYQPHFIYEQPGAARVDFGNVAFPTLIPLTAMPKVQLTALVSYALTDKLNVQVTQRWRPALQLEPSAQAGFFPNGPKAYNTTSMNLTYQLGGEGDEIYLNIRNLFDKLAEPSVGLSASAGYAATDDPIGRYYTVGFRARF